VKIALESRTSPLEGKGEGSNKQPKYRCVLKIALESRKTFETQRRGVQQTAKISLCDENRVREQKIAFEW